MRILDKDNNEIFDYDPEQGRVVEEEIFKAHHEAVEAVEEVSHYAYGIHVNGVFVEGEKYASGGQDRVKVIDTPGVEAREAWDETETILRYTPFTADELKVCEDAKAAQISTDDLILMMADHEYRICLMELGVNENDL